MKFFRLQPSCSAAAACLLFTYALSQAATKQQELPLSKFFGWKVDSITVSGNAKTRDFVILRELETQPGAPLDSLTIDRDHRFLEGLGLFAAIALKGDSLGPGICAIRIAIKERSSIFLKTLLPVVNYDFNKGFSYGLRWNNRNFRGRREALSASYLRNADNDDNASFNWSVPWIGMKHIGTGSNLWFYNRSTTPQSLAVLEQLGTSAFLALPLTRSRIAFSQVIGRFSFESRTTGSTLSPINKQEFMSTLLGLRMDSRDSGLKPKRGRWLYLAVQAWSSVGGKKQTYYRLWNDLRFFYPLNGSLVFALQSNLNYQFGSFPEYSRMSLGGSSSLRGYPSGEFSGEHVWHQTVEGRYNLLSPKVFKLPFAGFVDISLSLVVFVDSGIAWAGERNFAARHFHGAGGFGLRLYSPFQDVVRFDLGFNGHGGIYPYMRTGIRF